MKSKWVTTMSTSDPDVTSLARSADELPGGDTSVGAVPAGVPDPAVLSRIANEFFTAVPGAASLAGSVLTAIPSVDNPALSATGSPVVGALPFSASCRPSLIQRTQCCLTHRNFMIYFRLPARRW